MTARSPAQQEWTRGFLYTPFPVGHGKALTIGARSPRVYGEVARLLTAGLLDDRPDLENYPEAVAAWAQAEAQAALMRRHLEEVGTLDPESGEPRKGALHWLDVFEKRAHKAREPLGLDPLSDAKLVKTRAEAASGVVDLNDLAERGRAARAAREDAGLPDPTDHPDVAGTVLAAVQADARQRELQAELEHLL